MLKAIVLGKLGLSLNECRFLTVREILLASEQYDLKTEFDRRLHWEIARWRTMFQINWAGMKSIKTPLREPKEIVVFEWEKVENDKELKSKIEQAIADQDKIKRRFNIITGLN